jgi:signal transduction histidine kinase
MGEGNLSHMGTATTQLLHDARNHLANLSGLGQLLGQSSRHPDAEMFLRCVHNETRQIAHLLESLCALAHGVQSDEADVPFEVSEHLLVLAHALQPIAQEAGVHLRMSAPPSPIAARGKPRVLNRLLGNLIRNAITHASAQRIGVSVALEPCAHTGAPRLRYVVRDDGIGVAAAMRRGAGVRGADVIGHGHGLSICGALARQLGATLRVGDGVGGGTDAVLELPLR